MSCAAIMTANPLAIEAGRSVAEAAELLLGHRYTSLPVIDAEGRYVGLFGVDDLLGLLVPRVALAGGLMPNLRFISDDPADLRRRYRDVADRRVGDVANRQAPTLPPDAPQIEAIRLFCRDHRSIAVVADGGTLAGIITHWDAIRAIARAEE